MDLLVLIAKAADVCLKPYSHAVVPADPSASADLEDLTVRIDYDNPAALGSGQVIIASPYLDGLLIGQFDVPIHVYGDVEVNARIWVVSAAE